MDIWTGIFALMMSPIVVGMVFVLLSAKAERKRKEEARLAFDALQNKFINPDSASFGSEPGYRAGVCDGAEFGYFYAPGDKNNPSAFKVSVMLSTPVPLHITRETWLERFFKGAGISVEPVSGERPFDEEFYIQCDAPGFARALLADPAKREAVREIFRLGFHKVSLETDWLTAISGGGIQTMSEEVVRRIVPRLTIISSDVPSTMETTVHLAAEARRARVVTYGVALVGAVFGLTSYIAGAVMYDPLDPWDMFFWSIRYSSVAVAVFVLFAIFMLRGKSTSHLHLLITLAIAIPGFVVAGHGAAMMINGHMDESEPSFHAVLVVKKYINTSKNNRFYHLAVNSWRMGNGREDLLTTEGFYKRVEPGKTRLEVTTKSGKLGFEWVTGFSLAAENSKGS